MTIEVGTTQLTVPGTHGQPDLESSKRTCRSNNRNFGLLFEPQLVCLCRRAVLGLDDPHDAEVVVSGNVGVVHGPAPIVSVRHSDSDVLKALLYVEFPAQRKDQLF